MENSNLIVSATPHIRSKHTTQGIMLDVIIALIPAAVMGTWFYGIQAALIMILTIASCVFFEGIYQKLTNQAVTISDLSAVVTGLLLAMNLPASAPAWMAIVGSFFAIVVVKQLFGGLGHNFMNPALGARAFLLASYPTAMTSWSATRYGNIGIIDANTGATPLAAIKEAAKAGEGLEIINEDFVNALIGNIGGTIGEVSAIALLLGGLYLIARKVISWRIPVTYIITVFVLMFLFGRNPGYEILIGGLMLGAFFMATDYATSPITAKGQFIMGFGCGLITCLIRVFGSYPEGVSYSILLMNLCVPLIDRYTRPKKFGEVKKNA